MIMSFSVYFICGCKNETKKFGNYRGHNNWFLAEGPPSNNSRRGGYATRGGPAQSNRGGSSSNRGQGGRGNRSSGQRGGPRGNRSRGQPQYHPNRDSQQRYNNNSSPRYQSSTPRNYEKTIENYDSSYVDLKYESTKSIHIIFDINGTLGSLTKNAVYTETGKIINYRPYIEKLIELQEHAYEIGIWSSATFKNVRQQIIEIYKKGNLTKKW
eukprot:UN22353